MEVTAFSQKQDGIQSQDCKEEMICFCARFFVEKKI